MGLNKYTLRLYRFIKAPIRKLIYAFGLKKYETSETYRKIIPAEITTGQFYQLIKEIASQSDVFTILEIGSSSGEGSTKALFEALSSLPKARKQVHCMEISKERHERLTEYLKADSRFHSHRLSSVLATDFPPFEEVSSFRSSVNSGLSKIHIDTVRSWYEKDLQYLNDNPDLNYPLNSERPMSGIHWIKKTYEIDEFDFVIIDGGEFTGISEYKILNNSRYFALDDTNSFKNWHVRNLLSESQHHRLIAENLGERNGWAIFAREEDR